MSKRDPEVAASATSSTETLDSDPGAHGPADPSKSHANGGKGPRIAVGDVLQGRFRYELVRHIQSGGFGSVFEARCLDIRPGDPTAPPPQVALKVLGPARDARATSTLKRELSSLLAIKHERIPRLFDWSVEGEVAFTVLEFFASGSLVDAWSFIRRFDEEQTWRLISDLLSALCAAHRQSILHLDVKPSNVLLDGNGGFVLTDFGVAQASRMSRGLMYQGQLSVSMGTHGYRAPEQVDPGVHSFDLRTDLWGVGATAWALYTGIDLNSRRDVLRTKENGNIYGLQRLSDVRLHCPPALEEVVMGLLYIDPALRPGGAAEVIERVRAIGSGFGLDTRTITSAMRSDLDPREIQQVIDSLVDPLWISIARAPGFERHFVMFEDGEIISDGRQRAHHTLLLLKGQVRVERGGRVVAIESREGSLMSAISTLADAPQRAVLRAHGPVWACLLNEAELEQLVTCNPAVAVRMVRDMAKRIADGPPRHYS